MNQKIMELREQRLQKLFDECQRQVIAQMIGPFGLSPAMFEDKNGGNVTTLHNFSRDDDDYVATDSDKALHANSKRQYDEDVRSEYEVDTKEKAKNAGGKTWEEKRAERIKKGKDEYTGREVSTDGTITLADGRVVKAELDHVVSISEVHNDPKMHLALAKVETDAKGETSVNVEQIRAAVNHDDNLALTNKPLNGSKSDENLKDWADKERADGSTNTEKFEAKPELVDEKYETAQKHIDSTANRALFKKQAGEVLKTGSVQAAKMGLRQALGVLLTELVNGLFNEFKVLIRHGVELGKTLMEEIRQRLARVIAAVARKIPDAAAQAFQGGVSGFMSNLLTFLLNNFLSTAKRFVTAIREGLRDLIRAFRMIFFPPKDMTGDEALQAGLQILAAAVVSTGGILLSEAVAAFLATLPFLQPVADIVASVLIGITTGLLSAFIAYQIDCWFDRRRHSSAEQLMDELMADAQRREAFATELVELSESSLNNIENYSKSISLYQDIGATLARAASVAGATLVSLEHLVEETGAQVAKSRRAIDYLNESQLEIDAFLKTV